MGAGGGSRTPDRVRLEPRRCCDLGHERGGGSFVAGREAVAIVLARSRRGPPTGLPFADRAAVGGHFERLDRDLTTTVSTSTAMLGSSVMPAPRRDHLHEVARLMARRSVSVSVAPARLCQQIGLFGEPLLFRPPAAKIPARQRIPFR